MWCGLFHQTQRFALTGEQLGTRLLGQIQHGVHFSTRERGFLSGALHLNQPTVCGHHHVKIGIGIGVFGIVKVDNRLTFIDTNGHRRNQLLKRITLDHARTLHVMDSIDQRYAGTGNRSRASAAIRLDHVAVHCDSELAQFFQIDRCPQRTPDQTLNLQRAATLLATRGFTATTSMRRTRQHAVLRRHPPLTLTAQPARHAHLDGRIAQHFGIPELDQHRAFSMLGVVACQSYFTQGIVRSSTRAHSRTPVEQRSGRALQVVS
ncbi:amino acid transporters [Zymobacter palmae]|uniref:Amino acid transporters n=1 Tax=Zymobacter palmae TaxID=33074 RepID=A0A348HBC0_9GAMM|nr:amino acid transporters [Zymobacter palmae]